MEGADYNITRALQFLCRALVEAQRARDKAAIGDDELKDAMSDISVSIESTAYAVDVISGEDDEA